MGRRGEASRKSGVLSAAKKLEFTLFQGMRKTIRDAEGHKNRVNTEFGSNSSWSDVWVRTKRERKGETETQKEIERMKAV